MMMMHQDSCRVEVVGGLVPPHPLRKLLQQLSCHPMRRRKKKWKTKTNLNAQVVKMN